MKLELGIMAGPESKAFLVDLTKLIERMERAAQTTAYNVADPKKDISNEPNAEETSDADDFSRTVAPQKKKTSASFDDETMEEEQEEIAPPKETKKKKAAAITIDQVNDAAKALVNKLMASGKCTGKEAREKVLKLLVKNFNTKSLSEIDAADYAELLALLEAGK